ATAFALAQEGASVILVARRADRLKSLADRIAEIGAKSLTIVGDVAEASTALEVIKETKKVFGRVDILVNNAGVMLLGPIDRANTEDWEKMIKLNVLGLMYFTKAAVAVMKEQKSGHIVNLSSVAGRLARAGSSGYNASKWAVGAFSEALRQEVCSDNIRVTLVEPGMVLTELTDHITHEDVKEQVKNRAKAMTALNSEDIADTIVFAVTRPSHVNINEILVRPTEQQI
ncbi:MAG: SDR family NAD(P)-dependent oxidoreductase, partial [Candidatus Obscuribacterales bacterium]|nr:SDR family NAD(P)-dependent oxidoreductase [Candidatus Obscuribacterales bacterium]